MKMIFNYDANKTHFHNKGFALSLVLKVRFFETRNWPIQTTFQVSFTIFGCFGVIWEIRNEITKSVERFEDLTDFHNVQTY